MMIFLLTAGLIAFLMLAMAVGVIFSGKELRGSCGGSGQCACEKAGRPRACEQLDKLNEAIQAQQSNQA